MAQRANRNEFARLAVLAMRSVMALAAIPAAVGAQAPANGTEAPGAAPAPTQVSDLHDEEAQTRFRAASMAYADGRFEDALHDFQRAHELSGRPELLFNVASAADRLRRDAEALAAYEQYLEATGDPPNRRFVESRIEMLRQGLESRDGQADVEAEEPAPQSQHAPTPQQAAAEGITLAGPSTGSPDDASGPVDSPRRSKWWLWATIGAVVVGAVVVGALMATRSTETLAPPAGDDGRVHEALGVRW